MKRFLDVFLEEWKLAETQRLERADVRRKLSPPAFPVFGAHFDVPLKEGEIRIFADVPEPLVALLLKRRARGDWLLVPVSPFTVPATEQEIILGEKDARVSVETFFEAVAGAIVAGPAVVPAVEIVAGIEFGPIHNPDLIDGALQSFPGQVIGAAG